MPSVWGWQDAVQNARPLRGVRRGQGDDREQGDERVNERKNRTEDLLLRGGAQLEKSKK